MILHVFRFVRMQFVLAEAWARGHLDLSKTQRGTVGLFEYFLVTGTT